MWMFRRFFVSNWRYRNLQNTCGQKDLRIASLEGLLEDKKREAIGFRTKVLRGSIRSLQRQLERIEARDGI